MDKKELEDDKEAIKEERKICVPKFLIGVMKLITTAAFIVWLFTTIKLPWLMQIPGLDPNLVFIGWISLGGLFVLHISISGMIDKAEMKANFDMKTDIANILNALQRNR